MSSCLKELKNDQRGHAASDVRSNISLSNIIVVGLSLVSINFCLLPPSRFSA